MDCPVCKSVKLVISERQGIEIDYCPDCRGVWLDRGELDKMIERAAAAPVSQVVPQQSAPQYANHQQSQPQHYQQSSHGHYQKKKKREGFLADIFDFD
jgi:Zn-finger nucleic acid-binding protein